MISGASTGNCTLICFVHICVFSVRLFFLNCFLHVFLFFNIIFALSIIYKTLNNSRIYLFSDLYFKQWSNFTLILTPSKKSFLYVNFRSNAVLKYKMKGRRCTFPFYTHNIYPYRFDICSYVVNTICSIFIN